MKKNFLFTSESVSEGHPDKVCDRISDMVVDTYLGMEPQARVACETLTTTNKVVLAGETRGPDINKDELISKVRDCIKDIGYDQDGFTWRDATKIESHLHSQSTDRGFIEIRNIIKNKNTFFNSHGNKIFFYFLIFYISLIFFLKKRRMNEEKLFIYKWVSFRRSSR